MALGVDYVERVRLDLVFGKNDEVFILLCPALGRFGRYTENAPFDFLLHPKRYDFRPLVTD